jgi:hypothetical protein
MIVSMKRTREIPDQRQNNLGLFPEFMPTGHGISQSAFKRH